MEPITFSKSDSFVIVSLFDNTSPYIIASKTFKVIKEQNTKYNRMQDFDLAQFEICAESGITVIVR